jgi:single-stranded DNA-binding protein
MGRGCWQLVDPRRLSTFASARFRTSLPARRCGCRALSRTAFGKLANSCQEYLAKGRQISVQGRLSHNEWTTKDGERRERHEVVANTVEFLGQRITQPEAAEPQQSPAAA